MSQSKTHQAKPFLKWAGGKSQLIPSIKAAMPNNLKSRNNHTYIEPFAGSGAVLFWIAQEFKDIQRIIINDINADLINTYKIIQQQPYDLIHVLAEIQNHYYALTSEERKKKFYLEKRSEFNLRRSDILRQSATLIFLNRTCFNGLYRVNTNNEFNVPFGKYNKPKICDSKTIIADSNILQKAVLLNGDYTETLQYAGSNSFFYLDPPYKPISKTSSFNAYSSNIFDDEAQKKLKQFCDDLTAKNCNWLLSNSDPKNTDVANNFFEDLYAGENIYIKKVKARRAINSKSSQRGEIAELLISNYAY